MKNKEKVEQQTRGWLPKELPLPSHQRIKLMSNFMRLHFLRLTYGFMLSVLLVIPFGAYHSRVEPYVIGFLWGYHLPIGYVGLLLGIVAVLYPRLNKLRNLRFSSLMPFIGLSLLLSFFFSPKYYFINLIHGTSFSSGQIDVDSPLGNPAVMLLSVLSIVFGLASLIRGWLRKAPALPNYQKSDTCKNKITTEPAPSTLEGKLQRNLGILIGVGIAFISIGFLGWQSASVTYATLENYFIAGGNNPSQYYLFRRLIDLIAIYMMIIVTGAVSLLLGTLALKSPKVRNLFTGNRPNARLGGGLAGGGGALAFSSLRSLFVYALTSDVFQLEFFIVFFSIGILLVSFGALAMRRKS